MDNDSRLLEMTAGIITAYVSKNAVPPAELGALIKAVHGTLATPAGRASEAVVEAKGPAISIRKSIQPDFLVCLEDGLKFKSLRRHLRAKYGMTPEDYKAKWSLPKDYPMVAPSYSASRAAPAKKSGLGRKPAAKPAKRPGPKKAAKAGI